MINTNRWRTAACSIAISFLCGVTPLLAQSLTRGTLRGVVQDSSGLPLFEARVAVRETASGYSRALTTDREGRFELSFLPAGDYELRAEQVGYRPLHVRGVGLEAGAVVRLPLALSAAAPPVERVDSLLFQGAPLAGVQPGVYRTFGPLELRRLPEERRELTELVRMSSASSDDFVVEGLPSSLGGLLIDGVLVRPLPGGAPSLSAAEFPLAAFDGARLIAAYPDVEWSGLAGGALSGLTRRGTSDFRVGAFGSWSRGDLDIPAEGDPLSGSLRGLQGGAVVSGPILRDTANFIAGVEFWSLETPVGRPFGADSIGRAIGSIARDSFDVALGDADGAPIIRSDVVSLFGRFDWQLAPAHALTVGVTGALLGAPSSEDGPLAMTQGLTAQEGRNLFATASVVSVLSEQLVQELRLSVHSSTRESPSASSEVPTATRFADGLGLGLDFPQSGNFARNVAQASGAWYANLASHRVKVGISGGLASHERDPSGARWGGYRFAGPEEFARGEGSFAQTLSPVPGVSYLIPRGGIFAQDSWAAAEGLELTLGLRYDLEQLPADEVRPNQEWFERTGLDNADVPSTLGSLSPRFGFAWDVGGRHRWLVRGAAGVFNGYASPEHLSQLLMDDGSLEVRRAVGNLETWPAAPSETVATVLGPTLTLFAPGYRAPRTTRGSLGISRFLDSRTAVHLQVVYRRTEFLPRRVDLNLLPSPVATDAFGQPIYGTLIKQGGMLAVEPGSNRRFADFDVVSAINSDGSSDYQALGLALERRASDWLNLFGSYTYSRTTDDWLAEERAGGLELYPVVVSEGAGEWIEGKSDLDVPHRLAVGSELRLPVAGGLRLAGLYRFRSGTPFTPGYAPGVDINGDGFDRNDPAFVSDAIAGIEPLLQEWPCLRQQLGALTERNSCRTEGVHTFDLRLALPVGIGASSTEIFLDALNLTGSAHTVPDRTLYLVDPDGALQGASDGTVTVPLLVNENFGNPLIRYASGRQFRIGLRIDY